MEKPPKPDELLQDLSRSPSGELEYRGVTGGMLVQTRDTAMVAQSALTVVTRRKPTPVGASGMTLRSAYWPGRLISEKDRSRDNVSQASAAVADRC